MGETTSRRLTGGATHLVCTFRGMWFDEEEGVADDRGATTLPAARLTTASAGHVEGARDDAFGRAGAGCSRGCVRRPPSARRSDVGIRM